MIGNDVVDLSLAKQESNWQRPGFLQKIFTPAEQHLIFLSKNQHRLVWDLWARKEAVYKIIIQQFEAAFRGYYPTKIEVADYANGLVTFQDQMYYTQTLHGSEFLHCIALPYPKFQHVQPMPENTVLQNQNGIPHVLINDQWQRVSKSHHGRFTKIVGLAEIDD